MFICILTSLKMSVNDFRKLIKATGNKIKIRNLTYIDSSDEKLMVRMIDHFTFLITEKNLKLLSFLGVCFNIYALSFEVSYCVLMVFEIEIFDIFTVFLLVSWIYNICITFFIGFESEKHYIGKLSELYLTLTIVSPLFMLLGNFLISASYYQFEISLYSILSYFGFFSLSICGFLVNYYIMISIQGIKALKNKKSTTKRSSKRRSFTCKTFLIIGFLYSLSLINGSSNYAAGVLAAASQVSLGFFFAFIAFLLFLIKTKPDKIRLIFFSCIGIFTISTCLLPLFSINFAIVQANFDFESAFGSDWDEEIESNQPFFLDSPYSISKYLLGESPKKCEIIKDILYYEGDGIQLYFDAFIPPSSNLPGNNSVLISIHGGGWSLADKGFTNKIQNNKYFAAQGYVVFDIQYGLTNSMPFGMITPENVKGDFTIDDMVRHVGIFTKYLANYSEDYNANLDSVFITGGSSGGQLACAVAFAHHHPSYSSLFSQALTIKGIIPLYPANGIAISILDIPGSEDLVQPELLINQSSPPCLVIHGSSDGIVDPSISLTLKNRYLQCNNPNIVRILLPFAGHVLDYYFTGVYNQACLYYMERFLYLFH